MNTKSSWTQQLTLSSPIKIREYFDVEIPSIIHPEEQLGAKELADMVLNHDDGLYESYLGLGILGIF